MFEKLFQNKNIEKILFFLLMNDSCHATELKKRFETALSPIQKSLERLEQSGVLVSRLIGKTRLYEFNPRYPFLGELKQLFLKAYESIPEKFKEKYYEPKIRKRPRRKGKPL